ncbi:hypothetical protein L6452_19913 [Arctium lappa]|uniref:Uncharacterized protein n=1 Tax=Arctium lappa TaxID=4217 RepID=A0ACB9BAP6_ARCLA|nr:hypothetical protein L6452_19913 [Arctium lappa]
MAEHEEINNQMADLDIEGEENGEFFFEEDIEEEIHKYDMCLVGRFLTEKNLNFRAMRTRLADVWKATMGIKKEMEAPGLLIMQCLKNLGRHRDDVVKEWGSWLRAPPRKTAAQGRSKWLREDGDREWKSRFGRDYNQANFGASQYPNKASESKKESDSMNLGLATVNNVTIMDGRFKNQIGGKSFPYITYPSGSDEEELDELNV